MHNNPMLARYARLKQLRREYGTWNKQDQDAAEEMLDALINKENLLEQLMRLQATHFTTTFPTPRENETVVVLSAIAALLENHAPGLLSRCPALELEAGYKEWIQQMQENLHTKGKEHENLPG